MKSLKLFAVAALIGVIFAGSLTATTYAWHPEVKITKYVTNVTSGGLMADANDADNAVGTKPGDTIKYTMVIENTAKAATNGYNDLHFAKMTDKLPAGVELASDPSVRDIAENLGILKPGDKVTKEYILKVTSTKNGDVILNEACATGDSEIKDAPRKDCDIAVIKVSVTPPTTPELPKETPKVLPATGPTNTILGAGALSVIGYVGNLLRTKRRSTKN